ncbi:hypothetical protein RRG08_040700 [Elysia crispata]|uniref:Uncharacterized protein n=1 Tax=Elysia crispata TaxID=231223 RepID=A0AAE1AXL4_9GAST|nr:hypothetical protein RRG08_040700 [Elysia crispata]
MVTPSRAIRADPASLTGRAGRLTVDNQSRPRFSYRSSWTVDSGQSEQNRLLLQVELDAMQRVGSRDLIFGDFILLRPEFCMLPSY